MSKHIAHIACGAVKGAFNKKTFMHTAFPRNFYPAPVPSKTQMDIYNSTGVEVTYDWRTQENFALATKFLKDMVGAPTSADLNNRDKPWFYYFRNAAGRRSASRVHAQAQAMS